MTIDADQLAHRAYCQDSPGYTSILEAFGKHILDDQGQIDRKKLAEIVFTDQKSLQKLESLIHPLVKSGLRQIIAQSELPIITVEAIKLIESGFSRKCNTIWLVDSPMPLVKERLLKSRYMQPNQIDARADSQSSQEEKKRHSSTIINNTGSVADTWQSVCSEWKSLKSRSELFCENEILTRNLLNAISEGYLSPVDGSDKYGLIPLLCQYKDVIIDIHDLDSLAGLLSLYDLDHPEGRQDLYLHLLCTHHVWQYGTGSNDQGFLIASLHHFRGIALDLSDHHSPIPTDRKIAIRSMEGLNHLHHAVSLKVITVKGKDDQLLQLGYDLMDAEMNMKTLKAEYNVYIKGLFPQSSTIRPSTGTGILK